MSYDGAAGIYRFVYRGAVEVVYELDLNHPDVKRGRLAVRETSSGRYPMSGAGLYYRRLDGGLVEPWLQGRLGAVDAIEHAPVADGVTLTVRETLEGVPHVKQFTLRLVGRALEVRALSLDAPGPALGAYAGFTAGDIVGTDEGVSVRLPYMEAVPVTMIDRRWFVGTLLDYPTSNAGQLVPRGPEAKPNAFTNEVATLYPPDSAGHVRPVDETVWVVMSQDIEDVFPVPSQPASGHRAGLSAPVHLTLEGRAPGVTFADEVAYLDQLRAWRVTDLVVHKRHWRDETVPRPAQGPADPAAGGEPGLTALSIAAGGRLAPMQAYSVTVEGCPDAPNPRYRPADRVSDARGEAKRLADEAGGTRDCPGGTTAGRFLLSTDAARRIAIDDGAALEAGAVGAVHLETLPAWNPAFAWPGAEDSVIDRAVGSGHPSSVGAAIASTKRFLSGLQTTVGPVFGEGAFGLWPVAYDSFYAGAIDGVSRSLSTGTSEDGVGDAYLVVPDYELRVVRPRMVGYGMGDYERFFGPMAPGRLSTEQIDAWRATEIAYGHAGAWFTLGGDGPAERLGAAEQVKEYFLMRALQPLYLGAQTAEVTYVGADGTERGLSWALRNDIDLAGPRLHLHYGGAADVYVNHGTSTWEVRYGEGLYSLPRHGWLAVSSTGVLGYSALVDGRQVDYMAAPEWTVIDGRGETIEIGGLASRDLRVSFPDGAELLELPDGSLRFTP